MSVNYNSVFRMLSLFSAERRLFMSEDQIIKIIKIGLFILGVVLAVAVGVSVIKFL